MPNFVLSVHDRVKPKAAVNEPAWMQEAPLLTMPDVSVVRSVQVVPERY